MQALFEQEPVSPLNALIRGSLTEGRLGEGNQLLYRSSQTLTCLKELDHTALVKYSGISYLKKLLKGKPDMIQIFPHPIF